jgi:hypothetical protein
MSKRKQFRKQMRFELGQRLADRSSRLEVVPESEWRFLSSDPRRIAVYCSRSFFVQCFQEPDDIIRLCVNRTEIGKHRTWADGISWDELQYIKNSIYPDLMAVEIYPEIWNKVDEANLRHLWVLPKRLSFAWGIENVD